LFYLETEIRKKVSEKEKPSRILWSDFGAAEKLRILYATDWAGCRWPGIRKIRGYNDSSLTCMNKIPVVITVY